MAAAQVYDCESSKTKKTEYRGTPLTACVVSLVTTVSPSAAAAMSKSLPPVD
jgi:hypothetical protein